MIPAFGLVRCVTVCSMCTEGKSTESFTFENTSGGLRSDTVFSIFTDREGVVWIGTNRGVSRYDPQGPFQEIVSESPNRTS